MPPSDFSVFTNVQAITQYNFGHSSYNNKLAQLYAVTVNIEFIHEAWLQHRHSVSFLTLTTFYIGPYFRLSLTAFPRVRRL